MTDRWCFMYYTCSVGCTQPLNQPDDITTQVCNHKFYRRGGEIDAVKTVKTTNYIKGKCYCLFNNESL